MPSREGGDEAQARKTVTVAQFESPVEAQIAKGMLESAGIDCELDGEHANQLIQPAFEVQLRVRAEDEIAARELLDTAGERDGIATTYIDAEPEEG